MIRYTDKEGKRAMEEAGLKSELSGGILTFKLTGEIDHHGAKFLRERIDEEIFLYRTPKIIIDLSEISFMDSSGLGLLLGRYTKAKDIGCTLIVRNPTQEIMRILSLAGADKLIPIESSKKEKNQKSDKKQHLNLTLESRDAKTSLPDACGSDVSGQSVSKSRIKVKGISLKEENE